MTKSKRKIVAKRRSFAKIVVDTIHDLRRKGHSFASAWMRRDGFIKYMNRFWQPEKLAVRLNISV